jgi:hypothetical protein
MGEYLTGNPSNLIQTNDANKPDYSEWANQDKIRPTIIHEGESRLLILTNDHKDNLFGETTNVSFFEEKTGELLAQIPFEIPGKLVDTNMLELEYIGIGGVHMYQGNGGRSTPAASPIGLSVADSDEVEQLTTRHRFDLSSRNTLYMANYSRRVQVDARNYLPSECQISQNIWLISALDWIDTIKSMVTHLLQNVLALSSVVVETYVDSDSGALRLFFSYANIANITDIYTIYQQGEFSTNIMTILHRFFRFHTFKRETYATVDGVGFTTEPIGPFASSRQANKPVGPNGSRSLTFHANELTQYRHENSIAPENGFSLIGVGFSNAMSLKDMRMNYLEFQKAFGTLNAPKIYIGPEQTIGRFLFEIRVSDDVYQTNFSLTKEELLNLSITLVFRTY